MYNIGQTAVFLKDLTGREYPAIAEVNRKKRVNGQRELSLSFLYTEINKDFMDQLEFGWKVLFGGEWYTITHPGYSTDGDFFAVDVTAILSFFVDLNGYYLQDKVENKSSTPAGYFSSLFQGTPYSYVLVSNLTANTLSYQDNQSKTERFLYGIDRFNAEYKVQGKVAYIHNQIGNEKDVILHEDLNVNSVKIDVDASGFHTWAKGYGDLDDETDEYKLEVIYISPLAEKYGMIEGPAIKDGNYKHADALTAAVQKQVENSYIISTEIETVDLTNNGYPEMVFEEGDRIWLYVSKLNLNQQVRVMEVDEHFDWEGNIIDARYVVGNEGIATRYKTQQYDSIKDFRDITSGRKKLNYNWMPEAIRRAAEIINGNQDSLFKYGAGEIIGINQSNPNGYMRFNTDGIGFSRDGGKTYKSAMTYEGVVAESIVGSHIIGVNLSSVDENGLFHVNGADAEFINLLNNRYVRISPDGLFGYNANNEIRFQADRLLVTSAALGTSNSNVYLAPDSNNEVRVVDVASIPSDGVASNYSYRPIRAQGLRFPPGANGYLGTEGEIRITSSGFTQEDGSVIYRPLRAAAIYSNNFVTTSTSLWMGTDSAMHVVNKGFVENSQGTPIYRDIFAGRIWGTGFITQTENAYIGADGELRVVNKGFVDGSNGSATYRDVRASVYRGIAIDLDGTTAAEHMYVRPSSTGALRVTSRGTTDSFRPVVASEFNPSSSVVYKDNIELFEESGIDIVIDHTVYTYHLKSDLEAGIYNNPQIGFLAEAAPMLRRGDTISQYRAVSINWKATQELIARVEVLEKRLSDLEMVV